MTLLVLTIKVPEGKIEEVVDGVNETLNTLMTEGILDEDEDDAWAWHEVVPLVIE